MIRRHLFRLLQAITVVCQLSLPGTAFAATEYATFESFYGNNFHINWDTGLSAVFVAEGIVSLNPIALGVETVFFASDQAVKKYQYGKFVEQSKLMITLPLPRDSKGPDSYEEALTVLEDSSPEQALSGSHNQKIIKDAIKKIAETKDGDLTAAEQSRKLSLLALLHFVSNNYPEAKRYSYRAYQKASAAKSKATLPAFIYSVSTLYDEKIDFSTSVRFFRHALEKEPENPLTPLLFRIYLDRMMYRFNDGDLPAESLRVIYNISKSLSLDERKRSIQLEVLRCYLNRLEGEKITIDSLAGTVNKTIKDSPRTLVNVKHAMSEYKVLLAGANESVKYQTDSVLKSLKIKPGMFENSWIKVKNTFGYKTVRWERKWVDELNGPKVHLESYTKDKNRLEILVSNLEAYQNELLRARHTRKITMQPEANVESPYIYWIYSLLALLAGLFMLRKCKS